MGGCWLIPTALLSVYNQDMDTDHPHIRQALELEEINAMVIKFPERLDEMETYQQAAKRIRASQEAQRRKMLLPLKRDKNKKE